MKWVADAARCAALTLQRFIDGKPRNQYEQAVFQAVRTVIITAFLKPLRNTNATQGTQGTS